MKKALGYLALLILLPASLMAQHSSDTRSERRLMLYQDSLERLGREIINNENEPERKNANATFIRMLTRALKTPGSFNFKFDSVKSFTILRSPDNKFRIFTWHVENEDGSYRFYGTIQMNSDAQLIMHPLVDYSPLMTNVQDTITDNTHWYGCQYYDIVPVYGPTPYYMLLGWKGNTVKSTKKVIDVLSFRNGKPMFGMAVFDKSGGHDRIVFEYTRQASMLLKYIPAKNTIVFDHLSPPDDRMKNHPEMFGPDLSYDGYKLTDGRWRLVENLDMRNMDSATDAQFDDPKEQARKDRALVGHH